MDAATQTFAFIARKGAGKTYAAGKLAELLLEHHAQVVILDTVGNWYGLRISADGKGGGFDIPVFGGLRGDLPLQATAGQLVADVAVETGRSLIIDVSQFSLSDRKRFATAFGEQLWKRKKGESHPSPLMLMIEESQLIIPQFSRGDDARMVGIYEEIIRLGRNYGIGCTMISQRPQSVNKEVLNQTECLFVLQVNGAQERKSLKDWIVHQGMDVNLLDELPGLPVGTAYVWSPQWLRILKKVAIAPKITFDASSTPKVGDKSVRRSPAPLDLKEIEAQMAATIETAKANDPNELKKEISRLKREISVKQKVEAVVEEVPTFTNSDALKIAKVVQRLDEVERMFERGYAKFPEIKELLSKITKPAVIRPAQPQPQRSAPAKLASYPKPQPRTVGSADSSNGELPTGGLRRMLIALAQRPGLSARQLGVRAGLSSTSGSFNTYLSKGRSNGWLIGDRNQMEITAEGAAVISGYKPLPEGVA